MGAEVGAISSLGATALSAGVGALGSIAGSVGGGLFSANQARKNRAFQERMYNKQVEDTIKFWNMQNEYNLPSAAYAREIEGLTKNGLNPQLMYGNGAVQSVAAGQPQLPSAPHGAQGNVGSFHTPIDLANLALVEAQTRAINATAEKTESETVGQKFTNWLNDSTRNVQVALKYGDYDYVRQLIAESANNVFQSSFRNGTEMAALATQTNLAIRKQNLSEYEVGQNVLQGWQNVINGRISANAQVKSAFAAMMNATTAAKLAPYQIGVMRETAANYREQTKFLSESRSYRVQQEFQKLKLMQKDVTWYDILKESGISEQQSRTFLNHLQKDKVFQDIEYKPVDEMLTPVNMLTGFGAGMLLNGNVGRIKVKGFQP